MAAVLASTAAFALAGGSTSSGARPAPTHVNPQSATLAATTVDSCGYPSGTTGRPATAFNESSVLKGFQTYGSGTATRIAAFYNDEHALTLGKDPGVTQMSGNPASATNPNVGDTTATDPSARPLYPALFLTDITNNASDKSGDWQQQSDNSGAQTPSFVSGTWKSSNAVDPTKNNWTLGPGADTVPSGLANEGYGAEVVWNASDIGAQPGHTYRVQFMVHDGDQNQAGGDVGEACATISVPSQPTITTDARNQSNLPPSGDGSYTLGANGTLGLSDIATLSDGSPHASGTLTFKLYADNGSGGCGSLIGTNTKSVTHADGAPPYTSDPITVSAAGDYHWVVSFAPDGNDNVDLAATSTCGATNENPHVKARTSITTDAGGPYTLGANGSVGLSDIATLSGGAHVATGTLTFNLYADNGSGGCGTLIGTNTRTVTHADGAPTYTSDPITVSTAGDYHWVVSYDGDANNGASASTCGATNENPHVKARTSITTDAGGPYTLGAGGTVGLSDIATLSGGTHVATGTLTFQLFADNGSGGCGTLIGTNTRTVTHADGSPTYSSDPITVDAAGDYHWVVSYDGDSNNAASSSACGALHENPHVNGVDLAIEKHADDNFVEVGSQVGFATTVTGSGPAKGVTLSDPLPGGPAGNHLNWSIDSVSGDVHPSCHIDLKNGGQVLSCDAIDLGSGSTSQSYTVHVVSATSANGPGFTIKNVATASAVNHGDVVDNDTAAGDTNPTGPGTGNTIVVSALAIEKHADDNQVTVGDPVGYLVTVTGSGPAKDVTLNDPLPSGPTGNTLTWSIDDISGDVTPVCRINGSAGSQTLVCNAINLGAGPDFSVPQHYQVHVVSATSASGPGFTIKNIAVASSSNHSPVKDDDTAAGDTNPTAPGSGNTIVVGAQAVLPERVTSGEATLNGPTGCVAKAFNARVRGTKIAKVVFILDGKVVKRVTNTTNASLIQLRVNPAKLRIGVHRLVVNVTFQPGSGTNPKTIRLSFQRCSRKLAPPRFTG